MEQQRQYIASQIRAGRLAKGYTQLDLAEKTNISLRSIQRIESAKVNPRAYTLGILTSTLGLQLPQQNDFSAMSSTRPDTSVQSKRLPARILIAAVAGLCLALFAAAFLAQSPAFPETNFEFFLFWAVIVSIYLILLVRYLKK